MYRVKWLFCVCPLLVQGQPDSVSVAEVLISAPRAEHFLVGSKTLRADSAALERLCGQSVQKWLQESTPVFLRRYGPGGLSSPSTRGMSSYHTALLWEGTPINSAVFGQTDLSLIPVSDGQQVTLQLGGGGALYGSGYVGGALRMESPRPAEGLSVVLRLGLGSFSEALASAGMAYRHRGFWAQMTAGATGARNDFPYWQPVLGGTEQRRRTHNAFRTQVLLPSTGYAWKDHAVSVHLWGQQAYREHPNPPSSTLPGSATQDDSALRALLRYRYSGTRLGLEVRLGHLQEQLWYWYNPEGATPASTAEFRQQLLEIEMRNSLAPQWELLTGLTIARTTGRNSAYTASELNRAAVFSALRWVRNGLRVSACLRQERADSQWIPPTPSAGVELRNAKWGVHATANRVYRLPTLNERFWPPGNPNLQPEKGFAADVGVTRSWAKRGQLDLTYYRTALEGWVVWEETAEGTRPRNLQRVRSQGIELTGWASLVEIRKTSLRLEGGYTYTDATLRDSPDPREIGRQNLHTPYHQAWGAVLWRGSALDIGYRHRYTGVRYATTTGGEVLPAFGVGQWTVTGSWRKGGIPGQLTAEVDNPWNQSYAVQPGFPMPGRSYRIQLTLHFRAQSQP